MDAPPDRPPTTADLDALLGALRALRDGDFSVRLPTDAASPRMAEIAAAVNALAARGEATLRDVGCVLDATAQGQLGAQCVAPADAGAWTEVCAHANGLTERVTREVRGLSEVTRAVARGELSCALDVGAGGEVRALNETINAMVAQLRTLAAEVARVSREVGADMRRAGGAPEARGVAGVWKDLTENVTLAEQLALVSRYKSEFLANMSHELRTPLNSVLVLAKLLADNREANLTARQLEYVQTIHASGGDLLALVNDILDLSKVEAGRLEVAPREVPVADVTAALERLFRPIAEQKGVAFRVEVAPDAPARVRTDPQRLQQVLKNLVSNAFKFTARGHVALRVAGVDAAGGAARLAFGVQDTGIGIAPEKQELIFEAFQQADRATFETYGGTGLGLSISRELARLLGGTIQLESAPGVGSTFTLVLPVDGDIAAPEPRAPARSDVPPPRAPRAAVVAGPPAPDEPALAGRRILVVDDDVRAVFALSGVLEAQRAAVACAVSGDEALAVLAREPAFDAVLVDVSMPGTDGLAVMRALRRDPRHARLPLIAVTSRAGADVAAQCRDAGATAHVAKPVDPAALVRTIRDALVG